MARPAEPDLLAQLAQLRAAGALPTDPGPDALPRPIGRYVLLSRLGPDSYRALDPTLDRELAIVIGDDPQPGVAETGRRLMEVDRTTPVMVRAVGFEEGRLFLVIDYASGQGSGAPSSRGVVRRVVVATAIVMGVLAAVALLL